MLKTKFRTLTPQDPKCQILSHMTVAETVDIVAK